MKPGDFVRATDALSGTAQGPSNEHGDGYPCEIPVGGVCQVFDIERTTGWLTLHYDLNDNGPLEPYRCEAIAFPSQVELAARPQQPPMIPEGTPNIE